MQDVPLNDRLRDFARDWYFVEALTKGIKEEDVGVLREVLYSHQ